MPPSGSTSFKRRCEFGHPDGTVSNAACVPEAHAAGSGRGVPGRPGAAGNQSRNDHAARAERGGATHGGQEGAAIETRGTVLTLCLVPRRNIGREGLVLHGGFSAGDE